MDASRLAFVDGSFDLVACVQNGICAYAVDQRALIRESLRVLRPGGKALFSSYAESFWEPRLAWFERQAAAGRRRGSRRPSRQTITLELPRFRGHLTMGSTSSRERSSHGEDEAPLPAGVPR